ncbi:MAG: hypothetical protein AABZ15_00085 [Nitrospirota bacterium]
MRSHELNPRTLGASDYPSKTPLDEVISLMSLCSGAIILGYPQIYIEKGLLKDQSIPTPSTQPYFLPTEWNHIEAGLAHARGLPLLVIHHKGIRRGIFDRGAISNFIYERDLTDASWPLHEDISGAFAKWKSDLRQSKPIAQNATGVALEIHLIQARGVLWNRSAEGIEEVAYCPKCHLAMSVFPPGSDEMIACSQCNFIAPFRPSEIGGIIAGIKQ